MNNTPQLLPIRWGDTDLDKIANTFEKNGIVVLKDILDQTCISSADRVADRLPSQLDQCPWAAGEEYCRKFDIWTKVFSNLESMSGAIRELL